ncbi:polysaccharide deacetylase family protein [Bacillus cereus]
MEGNTKKRVVPAYKNKQSSKLLDSVLPPIENIRYTGRVEHLFFHPLIAYPYRAFRNDYQQKNMDDWFLVTSEFKKIIQSLYARQYILVNMNDLYETDVKNGTIYKKELFLPKGKKPIVFSIDDLNYYDYMREYGTVNQLVLDEKDNIAALSINEKGENVLSYENAIVPILDQFVKKHPDFSLKGAKGIINVTGFDGILGYQSHRSQFERDAVKPVVKTLKQTGWSFASHSYGHKRHPKMTLADLQEDADKWEKEVGTLVGPTVVYVYPYGENISSYDKKFNILYQKGFRIFYTVGKESYEQFNTTSVLIDRRHADGLGLRTQRNRFLDLYDSDKILDLHNRPKW